MADPGPLGAWILTERTKPQQLRPRSPATCCALARGAYPRAGAAGGRQRRAGPPGPGPALQILIGRLTGVADEMGAVLRRAAFSPNIKERADCSAALFTPAGELLVQAEHIPVHLGSMPASVRAAIDA